MTTPPLLQPADPRATASDAAPGPLPPGLSRPLYFYAHKPWVKLGEPIRLFEHLQRCFGPIAHYRFMGTHIVFVNEPAWIREVLINQGDAFVKERTLQRMKILLGEGLITADDPLHMRNRKLMAPAFHRQRIAGYADTIVRATADAMQSWHAGDTVDSNSTMMLLSLEIIAQTLFGLSIDDTIRGLNDDTNRIMQLYNFLVAFPALERVLSWPIPGVIQFRQARARMDAVVDRMIRDRRAALARGEAPEDLLTLLVSSMYEDESGQSSGAGMSDRQVRDEVLTIFLAGYETAANALTWAWYLLSQNPAVEARLHAELDDVLGTGEARRLPTLADLPRLRYTEQVFSESMRLFPPAWAMGRKSTRPVHLGPYTIPAGAHVFFSQYMMHRDPRFFPDPTRFDPDRFTPEQKACRDRFTYFPFGAGSRQCIGESFAWMEGILVLATVAQRWRLAFTGTEQPRPQAKITLRPSGPVPMRLHAR